MPLRCMVNLFNRSLRELTHGKNLFISVARVACKFVVHVEFRRRGCTASFPAPRGIVRMHRGVWVPGGGDYRGSCPHSGGGGSTAKFVATEAVRARSFKAILVRVGPTLGSNSGV